MTTGVRTTFGWLAKTWPGRLLLGIGRLVARVLGLSSVKTATTRRPTSSTGPVNTGLFTGGARPEPTRVKPAEAPPLPFQGFPSPLQFSGIPDVDGKIRRMRRKAVLNALDELGVELAPAPLWTYIDGNDDIGAGLDAFFTAIGVRPEKLKKREAAEVERANDVIDLLVEIDGAFSRLSQSVLGEICQRLFSGDFELVRQTAKRVRTFERIQGLEARWPPDQRLAIFSAFLDAVREGLADPLSVDDRDVAAAEAQANDLVRLMLRFGEAKARFQSTVEHLDAVWSDDFAGSRFATERKEDQGTFVAVAKELVSAGGLDIHDVAALIGALEDINARLEVLLGEITGRGTGGHAGGSAKGAGSHKSGYGGSAASPPLSERERALEFFGFGRGERPTEKEIRTKWRAFVKANHPDHAAGDEHERRRREEFTKQANVYVQVLVDHLVDVTA